MQNIVLKVFLFSMLILSYYRQFTGLVYLLYQY